MSYTANKIHEHLFQGGAPPPGDGLKKAGVDVLVLCAKEWQDATAYPGLIVIKAPGDDDRREHRLMQFIENWKLAAELSAEHVMAGRNVLITCMQGLNRSGLVMALTLRILTGWSGKKIVEHIQKHREHALFNDTFVRYIETNCP